MASMICRCGERLSNSEDLNEIQLRIYTMSEWDKLLEQDTVNTWEIPWPEHEAWRCPKCERVYLFEDGNNEAIRVYCVEE